MADLEIKRHLDDTDVREVEHLIDRVRAADGHQPIDEHRWVDAAHGGRSDFAGLVLRELGHDHLVAYAQVTHGPKSWAIDLLVDPHHRYDALTIAPRLLSEAVELIADEGGGHVHYWVYEPTEAHTRIAADVGLAPGRDLWQMRVPLPVSETTDLVTRPFEPGQRRGGLARGQQRGVRVAPRAGRLDARRRAQPRGRTLVRPRGLPPPRARGPARRLLLDEGPRRRCDA